MIPLPKLPAALAALALFTTAPGLPRVRAEDVVSVDGKFAQNLDHWQLYLMDDDGAEAIPDKTDDGKPAIRVKVAKAGEKRYSVQLVCKEVALHVGKTYHFHFRARSHPDSPITVVAGVFDGSYTELWRQEGVALKEKWTSYDCVITPKDSAESAQIAFSGLAGGEDDFWFADVSLTEAK